MNAVLNIYTVSYTHLRAHETCADLVCRLLLEKKKLVTVSYTHLRAHETCADLVCRLLQHVNTYFICLLYTSPSPRDMRRSRMPSSA
ncbi:hypothetical protein [Staphylococcus aureus]